MQTENTTSITPLTQTYNKLQHSKAKTLSLTTAATQQTSHIPHTVITTDIKTSKRHIHTSIVSRHLATRGNNIIMRTPPPHISSSEEIFPRLTRRTIAQLRTNKAPFLNLYLHKVDDKSHPLRTTLSPINLWTNPAGVTALLTGGRRSWLVDHNREDCTPPSSNGHGSG